MALLDSWRSGVAKYNYLRCTTVDNISSTNRITTASPTYYYGLARSINGDSSRAITIEILFRLSFRVKLPYSVTFI